MLDRKELIFLTGKVRRYNEFRGNSFARSLRVLSIRFVIRFLIAPRDTERERERIILVLIDPASTSFSSSSNSIIDPLPKIQFALLATFSRG